MSIGVLHGKAGGGKGADLTVTAPAGSTVTVSKDGKSKTKVAGSDGIAVFKGLQSGTWNLTITDGEQTASKTVEITADYATTITFFSATINITYPAGSTCTVTDGTTTLVAPDTSGTWACVVPNAGTWTVMLSSGFYADVSVAANGETIILNEWYLYDAGNEYDSLTGGLIAEKLKGANDGLSSYTITKNEDNITFSVSAHTGGGSCIRNNTPITLSGFSTLHFRYDIVKKYTKFSISIVPENYDHWKNSAIAYAEFNTDNTVNSQNETVTLPVSPDAVSSGKFYVILAIWQSSWSTTYTTTITARKLYFT